ncbi:ATP-binding cassette domain-containing protein [Kocuria rosea]|uniref:ABC transporter ATP-binding protein/permease n=1 Tax=Kocuria rosea TaxID=1275 RepID=UPI00232F9AFB|nr:ABC transporter ATP-binding protein/permease [Kocuria rosea]
MTSATPQLSLRQISRRYGDQRQWFAVREATLRVEQGELVAIVGPSGSGKSTLLNILGLLDNSWEGVFEINGTNVEELNQAERDLLRSTMFGFVFQSSYANPYESTARNAALGLAIQGESLHEQSVRVTGALEVVGLTDKADSLARHLSGGERQRLALARAIATNPQVILADEPTGNLDSASASRVMELLKQLNQRGTTVIVITHDRTVADYAHRVVKVRDGVLTDTATPPDEPPRQSLHQGASTRRPLQKPPRNLCQAMRRWPERAIRAINNVSSRPLRSITLAAAFAIAIAGMVTASGIGASASQQIADRLATAALDEVRVEVPADTSREDRQARIQIIGALPHVVEVGEFAPLDASTAMTSRLAQFRSVNGGAFTGSTVAVDEASLSLLEVQTVPAQATQSFNSGNVALVGEGIAESLGIPPEGFGAELWVSGRPYSVIGTITEAPRAPNLVTSVVVPVETLPSPTSQFLVRTETGYSASVAEAIPLTLSPSAPAEVAVSTTGDLRNLRVGVSQDLEGLLSSISVALLGLAVLGASSAMFLSVQSRIQELALSRALGLSRSGVATVFIWEGIIVGLAGSLAGLSIGLAASVGVSAAQGWTAVVPWTALALAPLVGIISGALSAFLPAIRAARIDPAEAIR